MKNDNAAMVSEYREQAIKIQKRVEELRERLKNEKLSKMERTRIQRKINHYEDVIAQLRVTAQYIEHRESYSGDCDELLKKIKKQI